MNKSKLQNENCFSEKRQASANRRKKNRRDDVVDRRLNLDRRRGPGKRRSDDRRSAEEGQLTDEQFEFLIAIDDYKKLNSRPFPSWTEVLEVIKALGYRKVVEPCSLDQSEHREPAELRG
ncbi:MAG: hypothetical protein PHP01_02390 [Phycisphaerae bacterium]|nr:hypothetical protein [Phycisphaerae bacterium]